LGHYEAGDGADRPASMVRPERHKQRLDEILTNLGLISEAQIEEALLRQKTHGGRFGSQLLCLGYIDEPGLVEALSLQLGCEGVVLADLRIPETIIETIPGKVALARKVLPFEHEPENDVLKIACEDPTDWNLIEELKFVASGKRVELFVAAEAALNRAIAKHYLGLDLSWHDSLVLGISEALTETGKAPTRGQPDRPQDARPAILLVTDEKHTAPLLQFLLERDNYRVVITDSSRDAIDLLGSERFHTVFLKETVVDDCKDLACRMRRISANTVIRHYEMISSLLLNQGTNSVDGDMHLENLDLFTSLLSCKANSTTNHSGQVGQYTNQLCHKLGLSDEDRLIITNAAYVHDLARFYYSSDKTQDSLLVIQLTIRLLESLRYSPRVLEMLRSMYVDLPKGHGDGVPIHTLGGNILTIADIFCDSIPRNDRLTIDKFEDIKKKLRDLVGKLFLAEVVETFIQMIQEEILHVRSDQKALQVMVYAQDSSLRQTLELRLKNEGFRAISQSSPTAFIPLYKRREPDMIILVVPGEPQDIKSFIGKLAQGGISLRSTPVLLVTDSSPSPLFSLLERGIEDIIPLDDNLNLLVSKIRKLEIGISARSKIAGEIADGSSISRGRLTEMNLIKLLQILGPSRKNVRITVQSNERNKGSLLLYLNRGQITFAQSGDLAGAEAVHEALAWVQGTWTVESVASEDFPPPNTHLSNESILTQGCLLLDEKAKAGKLLRAGSQV
jgi:DNA-binding response OmpR family regulator